MEQQLNLNSTTNSSGILEEFLFLIVKLFLVQILSIYYDIYDIRGWVYC